MIGSHGAPTTTTTGAGIATTTGTGSGTATGTGTETGIGTATVSGRGTGKGRGIENAGTGIEKRENTVRRPGRMAATRDTKVTPQDIEVPTVVTVCVYYL